MAFFDLSILRLVPLQFVVSDEAVLVVPILRVRRSLRVELVGPYELVTALLDLWWRASLGRPIGECAAGSKHMTR